MSDRARQYGFLAATTRVFALVALVVAGLLARDATAVLAAVAFGAVWGAATVAEGTSLPRPAIIAVESLMIGLVAAAAMRSSLQVLTVLAFPPLTAALRRGPRGVVVSLVCELGAVAATAIAISGSLVEAEVTAALTWSIFSLGLGLIGCFVHAILLSEPDPLDSYRSAQRLIRELIGLSGSLNRGLEPVTLAAAIASAVHDELPVRGLVVHVPRGEQLTPIIDDHVGTEDDVAVANALAERAFDHATILVDERAFALPLTSSGGTVAVVSGLLSPGLDPEALGLDQTLRDLAARLEPDTVHLDTALLFAAFRDAATSEERRRLAREMHDGVAQEMASLGYLVDDLLAETTSPELRLQLQVLRERLSAVVGEVRRSVRTLRTEVGESESLGTAIGSLARHLSAGSGVAIQVTLDESTQRLRPEVEAELLRIAQEAMNNAVRHAGAQLIEVQCTVAPPRAEIIVADDGRGIRGRREDSHGLEIMAERARLIEGRLTVEGREPQGTSVSVLVGTDRPDTTPDRPARGPTSARVLQR